MKREALAATAALTTAALIASGCSENNPAPAPPQESGVVACTPPDRAPWEAITGRPELPCSIGAITAHAVEFDIVISRSLAGSSEQTEKTGGSGTVVNYKGMKLVIGSAHVGEQAGDRCDDQEFFVPSFTGGEPSAVGIKAASVIPPGRNYNSTRTAFDANLVMPAEGALDAHPGLKVQEALDPQPGDTIFAMGYGRRRDVDPNPMSYEADHQKPVVIPGSVIAVTSARKVIFAVNTEGYEPIRDISLRPGDSGGTTVDANGNYLGGVALNISKMSGSEIKQRYGTDLPEGTEANEYHISVSQLVTAADVDTMLANTQPCKPAGTLNG